MRIGFLTMVDPRDPGASSGVPHHMRAELAELAEVVDIALLPPAPARGWSATLRGLVPGRLRRLARTLVGAGPPPPPRSLRGGAEVLEQAARLSDLAAARVEAARVDLLFGYAVNRLLLRLGADVPLVYATDATARLMARSYWTLDARPADYHEACDLLDRSAFARAAATLLATSAARRSAIADYGVEPARAHVLPLGANLAPPTTSDLRLVFVGFDPIRKRLDLAVETVERLRAAGCAARLEVIGRPTPRALASPWVRCLGTFDPAAPAEAARHRRALERAHLLVLPSAAECYGIAPCDAAHHGRPSVVSDAGGLPEVVLDGVTGAVLPVAAGPDDHARAILSLVSDPARYRRVSEAALRRAHEALSWRAWRAGVAPILEAARSRPRPALPPGAGVAPIREATTPARDVALDRPATAPRP